MDGRMDEWTDYENDAWKMGRWVDGQMDRKKGGREERGKGRGERWVSLFIHSINI